MKNLHLIAFELNAEKSNINFDNRLILDKWLVCWKNNKIIAKAFYQKRKNRKFNDIFDQSESVKKIDLGSLVDVLTFSSDLTIETNFKYQLRKILNYTKDPELKNISHLQLSGSIENGDTLGNFPLDIRVYLNQNPFANN